MFTSRTSSRAARRVSPLRTLAVAALLASCAQAQTPPATPAVAASPTAGTGAAPAAPVPPRPYRDVIKDSKEIAGFFTLHQKDEKVWMAIRPDQFDTLFFFSYNIPQSVGERGLYGSQMGRSALVTFKRIGNQVQLIAKNTEHFAAPGTPQAHAVSQSFSDSLLASAAVVSSPHPDTKAVLIDASALLFADIPGYLTRLETAFRLPFALDVRNTSFGKINNNAALTGLRVDAHFSVPKLSAPPLVPSSTPATPAPSATPDARSLFVGFYYNFLPLPTQPMRARVADERVGHFVSSRVDYTEDTAAKRRSYVVKRWRLEKSDPKAALSEPKQAIVYWLDKGIPTKYRQAVAEGVLEWNKAFEKIGFKNAIVV